MLVGSATKSVIAGSTPRATGCCASQPTRSSGNARQCWKRSPPSSPQPLRRRFAPAPPRPAGRRPDSPCLDYSGTDRLGVGPALPPGLLQHLLVLVLAHLLAPLLDYRAQTISQACVSKWGGNKENQ